MAEKGRGKRIDTRTRHRMLKLYCEPGAPTGWMYSIDDIAEIVGVDRRLAATVIREHSVQSLEQQMPKVCATSM